MSIGEKVLIKMRHGRELKGRLVAYDEHLNIMLGEASEKVTDTKTKTVRVLTIGLQSVLSQI